MSGLPMGWVQARLDDFCAFENGDRGKNYSGRSTFVASGVPFISAGHLNNGNIDWEEMNYIPQTNYDILASGKVRSGDFLFCLRGSLGKHAFVQKIDTAAIASSLVIIRPIHLIDSRFFDYYFRSPLVKSSIKVYSNGVAQPNLSSANLGRFEFPLPPLAEQKRIVAKLDALKAKSARARTELARIETLVSRYKQAVLSKAFSGKLTREWNRLLLGDALRQAQVGLVRSKEQQFAGGGTPYVRMNHFDLEGRWHLENITHVEASAEELRQFALQTGDVLFNTRNSFELVGKVAYWEGSQETLLYNNNILRMRFEAKIDSKFAFFQMQSAPFRKYLESVKSATTSVCAIYQKALVQAPFFVPESLTEQQEIVRRIESAFAKIDRLAGQAKRALELVGKLDEAILAKAFRGELVPQDENDEPADRLLARIRAEREAAPKTKRGRGAKA